MAKAIFIDELHTLVGAGKAEGAMDASNMLKPRQPERPTAFACDPSAARTGSRGRHGRER
jgi:hypothetical protein